MVTTLVPWNPEALEDGRFRQRRQCLAECVDKKIYGVATSIYHLHFKHARRNRSNGYSRGMAKRKIREFFLVNAKVSRLQRNHDITLHRNSYNTHQINASKSLVS